MPLQSGGQLGSPGSRGGISEMGGQGLSNGLIQGGKTGMVDLGGPVSIAAGSPANHFSLDGIGKSSADTSSVLPVPYVFKEFRGVGNALLWRRLPRGSKGE
ncbi:hypothetical protein E1A91_D07G019000v1 [Gossypium mustelinum]|uniref:Uncharacterized protein n=1 Tax=Gossypium mustelinum TaxID=34275 RepID=A0A5D2U2S4_GOSMU|nr:hypothetical protein E1A91_D07G019000v1 [Gossypium mustelinum]